MNKLSIKIKIMLNYENSIQNFFYLLNKTVAKPLLK
jgi:hypothetical protein